jgi:hypothetical protein
MTVSLLVFGIVRETQKARPNLPDAQARAVAIAIGLE